MMASGSSMVTGTEIAAGSSTTIVGTATETGGTTTGIENTTEIENTTGTNAATPILLTESPGGYGIHRRLTNFVLDEYLPGGSDEGVRGQDVLVSRQYRASIGNPHAEDSGYSAGFRLGDLGG
jgi:hypothetical protein